ncbi:hypothetical protein M3Y99_01342200 [Aphelenchoides fujianensis]|nr:hypothetical protein M3Y99_01342200 [Aphelenchoides fujianensis]
MWLILLFLLPIAISGAPMGVSKTGVSGENLPKKRLTSLLDSLNPFANVDFPQFAECLRHEMESGENTDSESIRSWFSCLSKTKNRDYMSLYNLVEAVQMEGDFYITADCESALRELSWENDTRLDVAEPLTAADRSNICAFLGDYEDAYCKLQTACSGGRDRQRVAIVLTQSYVLLQDAANGENSTNENCPAASIPFAERINPKVFTANFNATTDWLLDPSSCS